MKVAAVAARSAANSNWPCWISIQRWMDTSGAAGNFFLQLNYVLLRLKLWGNHFTLPPPSLRCAAPRCCRIYPRRLHCNKLMWLLPSINVSKQLRRLFIITDAAAVAFLFASKRHLRCTFSVLLNYNQSTCYSQVIVVHRAHLRCPFQRNSSTADSNLFSFSAIHMTNVCNIMAFNFTCKLLSLARIRVPRSHLGLHAAHRERPPP